MDGSLHRLRNSNMPRPTPAAPRARLAATAAATAAAAAPAAPARLPTYALYGEQQQRQATEALHIERIAERSQRHDWEIQPHRHESLFQILYIQAGSVLASLDGASLALQGPCAPLVPALLPHGFVFAPDVDGSVITVLEPHLLRLLRPAAVLAARLMRPQCLRWAAADAAADTVRAAVAQLQAAYAEPGAWRDLALDAALLNLAVVLGRQAQDAVGPLSPATPSGARALCHVQCFRALVEAHFRQQPTLARLAARLGITPTQLNRVCHQVLGHSALGVLHGRLVLEAQRDLAYTL